MRTAAKRGAPAHHAGVATPTSNRIEPSFATPNRAYGSSIASVSTTTTVFSASRTPTPETRTPSTGTIACNCSSCRKENRTEAISIAIPVHSGSLRAMSSAFDSDAGSDQRSVRARSSVKPAYPGSSASAVRTDAMQSGRLEGSGEAVVEGLESVGIFVSAASSTPPPHPEETATIMNTAGARQR